MRHVGLPVALRAAVAAIAVILVAGLTYGIERSHARARDDAFERFDDRGEISAQLISGSLRQSAASLANSARLTLSGDVTERQLVNFTGNTAALLPYLAVFEGDGTLVASHVTQGVVEVEASPLVGTAAKTQRLQMSDVLPTPAGDVLELHVPYRTEDGRERVIVNGYPRQLAGEGIIDALGSVTLPEDGDMYLFDRTGTCVGQRGEEKAPAAVVTAVRTGRASGTDDGDRYVVSRVEDTSLSVAVVAPERGILADLPDDRWPHVALVSLAAAMLALLALTSRAIRDARRLDVARREAADANEAKSRFLSYISHELKTPIAVIRGFSDLLMRAELEDKPREYVSHITESGDHLSSLVDELLDVARIEAGKMTLHLERVDVPAVIDEVLTMSEPLAAVRNITLEGPPSGPCPPVLADPMRVRQVLLNLVSNAIKYNDEGGSVRLTIEVEGGDVVRVAVDDDGPGIEPAAMGKLFDPFERLGAETGPISGSGLGLVVSKGLVEAMDGQMHVASRLGGGSSFGFELPIAEPAA
ncbi:MAG: hybrid sensor histidine kinase/response regulator [Thermoleophilia bacterium]|nr:hybrid sensor histidine kinase/response regulator [Thermoleophilia bacterium]